MNPVIGGVWYAASSRTPSTISGSVSLTARTVTRPSFVRTIVAGGTGPGGLSLASEERPDGPDWAAVEIGEKTPKAATSTTRKNQERRFRLCLRLWYVKKTVSVYFERNSLAGR